MPARAGWRPPVVVGAGHLRVGDGQLGVGRLQVRIRPGLDRQHGRRPDQRHEHRGARGRHRRSVAQGPPPRPPRPRLAPGGDRLVGHPSLDVVGQGLGRGIAILGLVAMAFWQTASSARSIVGSSCRGGGEGHPRCTARSTSASLALERRLAGQQAVKRRTQAVNVRARAQLLQVALGLLGAHVGRGPQRTARQRVRTATGRARAPASARPSGPRLGPAQGLGQSPVDDQRLAMLAHDDVARLDVAVEHATAVRVLDGVADVGEPTQELAELQRPPAGASPFFTRLDDRLVESGRWPP